NGKRVCGDASAGKREKGDYGGEAASSPEESGSCRRAGTDAADGQRETGLDGQLEFQRHELALRESAMRADAGRMYPGHQSDDGFRVRSALAVRAESSTVQIRVLGQGSAARYVDEQGRPGHDVPTAGDSAAGPAPAHRPDGYRHYLFLREICRWWRRLRGIPHH